MPSMLHVAPGTMDVRIVSSMRYEYTHARMEYGERLPLHHPRW